MSKITLNTVGSVITNPTSAVTEINENFSTIQTAFDNTLSRDGTSPNTVGSTLDMNSNQIINLPQAATANSPLRLQDLSTFTGGGTVTNIPTGGTTGQVLGKNSNTSYDVRWQDESSDLAAGTNISITGTTPATISTVTSPSFSGTVTAGQVIDSGLTVSQPVFTNGSKQLVSNALTGTGNVVMSTSPTLVTPALGTPSAVVLTSGTGLPVSTGLTGAGTGVLTALGTAVTGSTGIVLATSPTLVTPLLGTPTSGTLTNCTGLPIAGIASLGTGVSTALAAAVTGSSGIVLATSPTITTPGIVGVTNASSATAGNVGEYIESVIAVGSATALTTNTAKTVTSISLTAGDWDVEGNISFVLGSTTSISVAEACLSLSTNTVDITNGRANVISFSAFVPTAGTDFSLPVQSCRFNVSGTTSVFLVAFSTFTVSTNSAYGIIRARRIR